MLEAEDYSSDTSDEDFIPEGVNAEDADDQESEDEIEEKSESEEESTPGTKRKLNRKTKQNKKKTKRKNPLIDKLELQEDPVVEKEKEQKNEAEEAKKADNLWADFLADVDDESTKQPKPKSKNSWAALLDPNKKNKSVSEAGPKDCASENPKQNNSKPTTNVKNANESSKVKITKVFEFAGEEVRVEEEVPADSAEARLSAQGQNGNAKSTSGLKKASGLSSVLNLIDGKKKKLSTLEKSKLDWNSFKSSEGIEDELQTHLKSKEGYLEKKAFLERADLRQFEIEKEMRMNRRSNR